MIDDFDKHISLADIYYTIFATKHISFVACCSVNQNRKFIIAK